MSRKPWSTAGVSIPSPSGLPFTHKTPLDKRLLVHVAAFNLGLVMRKLFGKGTPRGLQGYRAALFLAILRRLSEVWALRRTVGNFMMAPRRSPAHQSSQP